MLDSLLHRRGGPLARYADQDRRAHLVRAGRRASTADDRVELRDGAPAASQERMKRELGALLQELSRTQPLVLFIDDLHWADVSTIDMLNYLAGRFADMRVLIADELPAVGHGAGASIRSSAIRSDLQSRGVFEEIGLGFLEPGDVERYLALQFPGHRFPPDFAARHSHEDGRQPAVHGGPGALPARHRRHRADRTARGCCARALSDVPRDLPGIGARHDRAEDRTGRRAGSAAAAGGQRAGP